MFRGEFECSSSGCATQVRVLTGNQSVVYQGQFVTDCTYMYVVKRTCRPKKMPVGRGTMIQITYGKDSLHILIGSGAVCINDKCY